MGDESGSPKNLGAQKRILGGHRSGTCSSGLRRFAGQLLRLVGVHQHRAVVGYPDTSPFFSRPLLRLAPGMGMATFAAVLIALGSSPLGASSGLARTIGAAIALPPVAVAADDYSAAAAGTQKEPGWRLLS